MASALSRTPSTTEDLLRSLVERVTRLEVGSDVDLGSWVLRESPSGGVELFHPGTGAGVELAAAPGGQS